MRPFRNVGWPHFDKVQAIVPAGAGARGRHVFRPTIAQPYPPELDDSTGVVDCTGATAKPSGTIGAEEAAIVGSLGIVTAITETAVASGSTTISDSDTNYDLRDTVISRFLKDQPLSPPTSIPTTSTSKRTHSNMSGDSNDPHDFQSASVSEVTLHNLNPIPVNKKQQTSNIGSGVSHASGASDVAGSRKKSAKMANQATQAAALMGMQGSINHLTDVFAESMRPPETETALRRKHALKLLQEQNDQLTPIQKARMASCFQKDISAADTYVSLVDPLVREKWINLMLSTN
jgi:hypothetical protein